ncbi:MAG: acetate--CoA ligase family protein [Burkholderiales bacterium]|jgi:acetyl-CoA synthetase (ADP-forming)|nr:acetate--CoA ligase family protein [Burkholderiales bacterium]
MNPAVSTLRAILNPRSVAVIGASGDPAKFGGRVMHFLVKHGYRGRIVPVHPSATAVLGIPAVSKLAAAGDPVDVCILALPAAHLPAALEDCGRAGARGAVVITADFAETGAAGAARQDELLQIARSHGMRLIGPNCLGFINPPLQLALTSSVALAVEPMPRGAIGLASQSGSLMASLISHAQDLGTGFSVAATVGNQADVELCDLVEYFIEDENTRAICLYIEGLKNGARFLELAQRARAAGKPILAVKAGRSAAGQQVTQSHTASLAGSYAVWEAACRDHAVCLLDDPEALIYCADFLIRFGAPAASSIAVMSPSGGTVAVTGDRVVAAGLALAEPGAATAAELQKLLPPGRTINPLDVGGLPRASGLDSALTAYELLAKDPAVGAILIAVATTPQLEDKVRQWGRAALAGNKPTAILLTPGTLVDGARDALKEIHCPYTNRLDDTLRVLRSAVDYGEALRNPPPPASSSTISSNITAAVLAHATTLPEGRLTEPETKTLLRAGGIHTTDDVLAPTPAAAIEQAQGIGYPVVLKGVCRTLVHKSEAGAVKLNIADADALRTAWREIETRLAAHLPGATLTGCVVQPMIRDGTELIVGCRWDAQFGPVVIIGSGGVLVEILDDVQMAVAPISSAHAHRLITGLRIAPVLAGVRGRPAADVAALADTIAKLSVLAAALGPRLVELDINPLLVRDSGAGVIALDARATLMASAT